MTTQVQILVGLLAIAAMIYFAHTHEQRREAEHFGSEEDREPVKPGTTGKTAMIVTIALIVALSAPSLISAVMPEPRDVGLEACEREIQSTLRAPSTYRRVSATSGPNYHISYDAENAFGVPMRGSGFCEHSGGSYARWTEYPKPSDFRGWEGR